MKGAFEGNLSSAHGRYKEVQNRDEHLISPGYMLRPGCAGNGAQCSMLAGLAISEMVLSADTASVKPILARCKQDSSYKQDMFQRMLTLGQSETDLKCTGTHTEQM